MNTLPKITNAIDAASYTRQMCAEHFNVLNFGLRQIQARENECLDRELKDQSVLQSTYKAQKSEWCKVFFSANFPRLLNTRIGRVLMGFEQENPSSYSHKESAF